LLLVGSLLTLRRVSGVATMPLAGQWLLAGSGMLAVAAWIIRWTWSCGRLGTDCPAEGRSRDPRAWTRWAVPSLATGLLLLAISTTRSGWAPFAGAWLVWLASEAAAWHAAMRAKAHGEQAGALAAGKPPKPATLPAGPEPGQTATDVSALPEMATAARNPHEDQGETDLLPPNLVQQVTRLLEEEGERVHALARVAIEAGDCVGVLHLAFGPPLVGHPDLTACVVDDPEATARVTDAETFGARIEVRLPRPLPEGRVVWVEVHGLAVGSRGRTEAPSLR
jgi:hypothetical protein